MKAKKAHRTRVGLQFRLTLFMLAVSVLPLIGVGAYTVLRSRSVLDDKAWTELQQIGHQETLAILDRIDKVSTGLLAAATLPEMASGDKAVIETHLKALVKAYSDVEFMRVTNVQGDDIAHTNEQAYSNFADRDWFKGAVAAKQPVTTQSLVTRNTGKASLALSTYVKNADGAIVGVLQSVMFLDRVSQVLQGIKVGNGGFLILVDGKGNVLSHRDPKQIFADASKLAPVAEILKGNHGAITYTDEAGTAWVANYRQMGPGWGLVVQRPESEMRGDGLAFARQILLWMATAAAGVVLLALVSAVLVGRQIGGAVNRLARVAEQLAEGDLRVEPVKVTSRDEIGDLAVAFNQMVGQLRELVRSVTQSSRGVAVAAVQLRTSSAHVAEAAQGVTQIVDQVAQGAGNQSRSVQETARIMSDLRGAIDQIAAGAQEQAAGAQNTTDVVKRLADAIGDITAKTRQVAISSEQATATAREGSQVVQQSVEGMSLIRESVLDSAEKMKQLGALTDKIGEITQTITGIAEQTNLLALNAAIEAARAGEHGRGFAVVADEVRQLAERAGRSAKEISSLVGGVQESTHQTLAAMQAGTVHVEAGTKLATDAGEALRLILATVEQTTHDVEAISAATRQIADFNREVVKSAESVAATSEQSTAATEEMSAGAEQVSNSVEDIAAVSEENAASAEEVSASVAEMRSSIEEIATSAESLTRTAQALQAQIAVFKVPEV